ncbi:hypothetical protein ABJI51_16640 [Amycolatopsis sp. NEAU-NG30]|uniref:TrbL/VirB6 plasmid conjugal transfer protein n=1 Tax=Amycolatopsis melonis TaxID=3156488 RepID=A0ABV0LEI1_9PSEU
MCSIWANLLSQGACQVVEWTGDLVADGAKSVAGSALQGAADSAGQSAGQLITVSLGWWTFQSSVDFGSPAIRLIQQYTMPLSVIMLMAGVILAAARTALVRRSEPLTNLAVNLLVFLVLTTAGAGLLGALQAGGDAFSAWIIAEAGANFGERFAQAATSSYSGAFGVILISLLCIVISFVQWVLMLFRNAALVLLAGSMGFAAAASTVQGRTDSAKRVVTWAVSILLYKPIGALIYAAGFTTISEGGSLLVMLQGVVILLMAIIALPLLVRLFSWTSAAMPSGGGGGIAAAAGIAGMVLARRPGGRGASNASGPGEDGGETDPGEIATTAGQEVLDHTQAMDTGGPGTGGGRDTPVNASDPADAADPGGSSSTGGTGEGATGMTQQLPLSGEGENSASGAAAAAATGGAAGGADSPTSSGAGLPGAEQTGAASTVYDTAQDATAAATVPPEPTSRDEPS